MPITPDASPQPAPTKRPVLVLFSGGRGSGRNATAKSLADTHQKSRKFSTLQIYDRDVVSNDVTSQAIWKNSDRDFTYYGLLATAVDNLARAKPEEGKERVAFISADWPARVIEENKIKGTDITMCEYLKELQEEFVVLHIHVECPPEKQFERVKKRHETCKHSPDNKQDICGHPRDKDILNDNLSDPENYVIFSADYHKRRARDVKAEPIFEELGIKTLKIYTGDDWPFKAGTDSFVLNDPKVFDVTDRITRFIVGESLLRTTIESSPPSQTTNPMPASSPGRLRSNSINARELAEEFFRESPFPWKDPNEYGSSVKLPAQAVAHEKLSAEESKEVSSSRTAVISPRPIATFPQTAFEASIAASRPPGAATEQTLVRKGSTSVFLTRAGSTSPRPCGTAAETREHSTSGDQSADTKRMRKTSTYSLA